MSDSLDQQSIYEGFSKLGFSERIERLQKNAKLDDDDIGVLYQAEKGLNLDQAQNLIENVIGLYSLPLGLATHFLIDDRDVAIPMAIEETSVVAAASAAAKWVRRNGGFRTRAIGNLIIGQIQFPVVGDVQRVTQVIEENSALLLKCANDVVPGLVHRGGGVVALKVRSLVRPDGQNMVVLHVLCNPCDAMGANLINQVCEKLKKPVEELTGERVGLCILSNLVDTKLVEATCEIRDIDPKLGKAIEEATLFANLDPYRGATHNKGVMNGIDSILIATGNDWRAVEAGIHAFVAMGGKYSTLTRWKYERDVLRGTFLGPLAVGTIGGVTKIHPTARVCLKILGVQRADELARVCAAGGLAQNLAALRALCSEGIVQGHMKLHASNIAIAAGAGTTELHLLKSRLQKESHITVTRARELLAEMRQDEQSVLS